MRTLIQQAGDIGELLDLKALALLQRHLMQEATIAAYQDCFIVVTALCVVVMPSYCSYDGSPPSRGRHTASQVFERGISLMIKHFSVLCRTD